MRTIKGAALLLGLLIAPAACGVDKAGAADTIVDLIGEANGRELTSTEKDCITELVMSFPEGAIKAIADRTADDATKEKFDLGTFDCLAGLGS